MNLKNKKIVLSFLPFLLLLCSFISITVFSRVEPNSLDQSWTTRQLIIGLFVFTSLSFLPRLLHLYIRSEFPFIYVNLSHHSLKSQKYHEMKFNNQSICAGCFGTSIGILLGNTFLLLYFFGGTELFNTQISFFLFFLGVFLILFTYSRYFIVLSPKIRIFQHSMLFTSLSFLVISSDLFNQSAFLMVFLLPSWLTFLITRIQLSRFEHKQ
jgi:hypothetical protein